MQSQVKNVIVRSCFGLSLLSILTGCGGPVTQHELFGTYTANYPTAKEMVTLLPGGQFIQQVTLKSGSQTFETTGVWTFNAVEKRIIFHKSFYSVLDGFGKPRSHPEIGTTDLPVIHYFRNVQIGDDPAVEYERQTNP